MDATFGSLETEILAFVQQQTADLEALRSDLNTRLDTGRKALESSATKLLQQVEQLRKQATVVQVSSSTATADVGVDDTKHANSTSEATQNEDKNGVEIRIQLQCTDANRLECALQAMKQDARFADAFLAHNKMQEDNIAFLRDDVLYGCLESTELFAVLCFIAAIAPVPVAVVSPDFFGAHANESQMDKDDIRSHDNIFCVHDDYEVLLMPVFVIDGQEFEHGLGHWIIGIYSRRTGVARIYNPALLGSVSPATEELILKAVRTSFPEGEEEPRLKCRFEPYGYNKQTDATSCGFFLVLYSELYVFRGEDQMYVIGFDIEDYRRSVVGLVQRLYAEFVTGAASTSDESEACKSLLESPRASKPCGDAYRSIRAVPPICKAPAAGFTDSVVAQPLAQDGQPKAQSAAVCADGSPRSIAEPKCAARAEKPIDSVLPMNERETFGQQERRTIHPSQIVSHCTICHSAFSGPNGTSCRPEPGSGTKHSHSFCRMCVIDHFNRTETGTLRVAQDGRATGCMRSSCQQFIECESLTELLSPDVIFRIREHCEKEMVLQMASLERCKNPKCDYAVEIEAHPAVEPVFRCAKCEAAFCRICKRDERRHGSFTCHAPVYEDGWTTASSRPRRAQRRDEQPVDNSYLGWRLRLPSWPRK